MITLHEISAFIFGAVLGSFANACIYRIPRELSLVHARSMCTRCGSVIRWYDNIPILSFLLLFGKCRQCKVPYGFQYLFVELFLGFAVLWIYRSQGISFSSIYLVLLVTALTI